jgi:hypothetical protein
MDFNKPIWRGSKSGEAESYILEGQKGSRRSANTSNHYTLIIDEQLKIVELFKNLVNENNELVEEINTQSSLLKQLKQTILQEAIEGKLTEKWRVKNPDIGTAKELLEQIKTEKEKLIKEKKLKASKPLAPINEDEIPFDIPKNWEWCRLGDVITNIKGGGTPSKANSKFWNGNIPWASVKDLKNDFIDFTDDFITEEALNNSSTNLIPKGNIIISTRMGLGKIAFNNIDTCINQDLKAIFPNPILVEIMIFPFGIRFVELLFKASSVIKSSVKSIKSFFKSLTLAQGIFPFQNLLLALDGVPPPFIFVITSPNLHHSQFFGISNGISSSFIGASGFEALSFFSFISFSFSVFICSKSSLAVPISGFLTLHFSVSLPSIASCKIVCFSCFKRDDCVLISSTNSLFSFTKFLNSSTIFSCSSIIRV